MADFYDFLDPECDDYDEDRADSYERGQEDAQRGEVDEDSFKFDDDYRGGVTDTEAEQRNSG